MSTSSSGEHIGFQPKIVINSLIPRLIADMKRRQIEKWGSPTGTRPHKCDPFDMCCAKPWDTLAELEERRVVARAATIPKVQHEDARVYCFRGTDNNDGEVD